MGELPDRLRAFVALRLSGELEHAIELFVEPLRISGGGVRWISRDNLHVTLRFLGAAVPAAKIRALDPALGRVAATTEPFTIRVRGTGGFPDLARPRVIWLGLFADPLIPLAARIEAAARECGLPPEPRPYSPHLTIGRVRNFGRWPIIRGRLAATEGLDFGVSAIDALILYQSILGESVRYQEIARYPLQPTSA